MLLSHALRIAGNHKAIQLHQQLQSNNSENQLVAVLFGHSTFTRLPLGMRRGRAVSYGRWSHAPNLGPCKKHVGGASDRAIYFPVVEQASRTCIAEPRRITRLASKFEGGDDYAEGCGRILPLWSLFSDVSSEALGTLAARVLTCIV